MTALLPRIVPAGLLAAANGMVRVGTATGVIVGPLFAGVFAARPAVTIAGDATSFAVSAALIAAIRVPAGGPARSSVAVGVVRRVRRVVRGRPWLVRSGAAQAAVFGLWSVMLVLGPVATIQLGYGRAAWAIAWAGFGAGAASGGLVASRCHPLRPLRLVAVASTALATGTGLGRTRTGSRRGRGNGDRWCR